MSDAIVYAEQLEKRRLMKEQLDAEIKTVSERLISILKDSKKAVDDMNTAIGEEKRLRSIISNLRQQHIDTESELLSLRNELTAINRELSTARADLATQEGNIERRAHIVSDLPILEEQYITLSQDVTLMEARRDSAHLDSMQVSNRLTSLKVKLEETQKDMDKQIAEFEKRKKRDDDEHIAIHAQCKKKVQEAEEKIRLFEMEQSVPIALVRHLEQKLAEKRIKFNVLDAIADYKGLINTYPLIT